MTPVRARAPIFTIGYQGRSQADVIAEITGAGVRTLIDVRDAPVSRKPGFSKGALGQAVADAGLAYAHLKALGTPKAGREAARAGRRGEWQEIFARRLASPEAEAALAAAALMVREEGPVCLLCFERDPALCHRTIVAERLAARLGVAVEHLGGEPTLL